MIRIREIKKSFGSGFTLHIKDLNIADGERVALIGANGSGKSTFLRLLAGIIKPDKGFDRFTGADNAGYLPQDPFCFKGTARYNIRLGQRGDTDADGIIKDCCLYELADKNIRELSGGERQRVCFARMLAGDYKTLLLDEPFSETDVDMADKLCDKLVEHCKKNGITLIMSTHTPAQALKIATKILIFNNGRIAEYSDIANLKNPESEFGKRFVSQWKI